MSSQNNPFEPFNQNNLSKFFKVHTYFPRITLSVKVHFFLMGKFNRSLTFLFTIISEFLTETGTNSYAFKIAFLTHSPHIQKLVKLHMPLELFLSKHFAVIKATGLWAISNFELLFQSVESTYQFWIH